MRFKRLTGSLFLRAVHSLTAHGLIKIHLVAVELRTLYAGETGASADSHAATSAHSGAINHKGIQTHRNRKSKLLC